MLIYINDDERNTIIEDLIQIGQFEEADREWLYSLDNCDFVNLQLSIIAQLSLTTFKEYK